MCGVFGAFGHDEASHLTCLGLHGLQHRGQESAGIVASDGERLAGHVRMGRVADIFDEEALRRLPGRAAVGHVRYSTAGGSVLENAQPFTFTFRGSQVAIAHNGNLTNAAEIRGRLEAEGALFRSTMDTEVFAHLLARSRAPDLVPALREAAEQVRGAYSLLLLAPDRLVACRDPQGFRPLVLGRLDGAVFFSSETCAFRLVGAATEREVEPGEVVVADRDGARTVDRLEPAPARACIFEHIYFARPDSNLFGEDVYDVRKRSGRRLAIESPARGADVVIPVPDSGNAAALGFARESGLPFEQGLIRSHYAGRTFLSPSQSVRDVGVRLKLSPVDAVLRGRSVVVVDDSLVRGTTSRKIVRLLRDAGAREVHMRIACPPTAWSCFYGIDTPDRSELIAARKSTDEIREFLGADSLGYLSLEGLHGAVAGGRERYCDACFSGRYPVPVPEDGRASRWPGGRAGAVRSV